MAVLLMMTIIAAAAVTFFVCFFTKLSHENTAHTCRVERISPPLYVWKRESKALRLKSNTASGAGLGR